MTETPSTSSPSSQPEKPLSLPEVNSESLVQSKAKKKKKKSGKKNPSESTEMQQTPGSAEGSQEKEQLNRQLDWCIEQLESGMSPEGNTKTKYSEEASRALKTLQSSKAPLAKKRQVMRAMTGDYRKKMEEEKSKQYKLIHSELASAQVKAVSDSPKKCVFHRRAEAKSQDTDLQEQTQEQASSTFVFTPSKEEFHFNFF
uniref:Zgc:112185 n=1 Tax=Labrus bergylta TaxID=56723 RepID=A0A3Q3FM65_9LABR